MKKLLCYLAVTLMLISLTGCAGAKPEATVEKYFAAAQKFDTASMASTILSSNTQDIEDLKNLMSEDKVTEEQKVFYDYMLGYLKANAAKMTYTVTGSEINGDSAVVTVDCRYVDAGPVLRAAVADMMKKAMNIALSGGQITQAQTFQMLVDVMNERSASMSETYKEDTLKINCTKKDDVWYINGLTDEMKDVITSGFVSATKDMGQIFGGFSTQ